VATCAVADDFALMLRTYGHLTASASAIEADAERVYGLVQIGDSPRAPAMQLSSTTLAIAR
jgi:hypothetical protein